jgi:hypothetical protein
MFSVHDKKVVEEINKLQQWMHDVFGIENATKEDAIRYLLKLKKDKKDEKEIRWDKF